MPSGASRDLGLERIGRTTRYLAVGGLIAGGVLTGAVAKALPGHSPNHRASTVSPPAASSDTTPPSAGSSGDSGSQTQNVSPPTQPPQPTYSAPVASSGGS